MPCTDCFNGCVEPTPDKCIRYTGINIPFLSITEGMSLYSINQAIFTYLETVLNGSGIIPGFNSENLCTIIEENLPITGDITLVTLIDTLTKVICLIDTSLTQAITNIEDIEKNYDVTGLEGVTSESKTHLILQATINKLIAVEQSLSEVSLNLTTNYVKIGDLDYLNTKAPLELISNKLVPNAAIPWFGDPTGKFDSKGAGLATWINVYLCNGKNGTPDMRGVSPIGATDGTMLGDSMPSRTNPTITGNPTYSVAASLGTNTVALTDPLQLPSHTHIATVDEHGGHAHNISDIMGTTPAALGAPSGGNVYAAISVKNTSTVTTGITVTNSSIGAGEAHSNVQPGIGCYYIMYIPLT